MSAPPPTCAICGDAAIECRACGGSASGGTLMSTAGCRGHFWAAEVARKVGTARDWPPFDGKARLIALRKVDDRGGDAATKERRAFHCWRWAEFEWGRLRDPSAPVDYAKWPG